MRFEYQSLFWLTLAAALALAAFSWWAWRTKQRLLKGFVGSKLLGNLTAGISPSLQKARMAMAVAAVTLVLLALARPQWGFDWEEVRQRGLDVVVAIDTSRSMLATDIPPNRLARAKLAALDLKRLARADRVGLVAFAGSAFLQCPLSFDDEAFRQSVNSLDVRIIPVGGSAIAEAIETARAAFKEKNDNHKVLVLFTDGEDNDGRAVEAAEAAAKDGMRIFTIGVGTANGELLRLTDGKGRIDYVRDDDGNVIKSRLNEKLLQDVARATQGFYMLLSGANTIELLYERGLAPLPKSEHTSRRLKRFHERYQWLLGLAIVLLSVEMLLPERKRVRRVAASPVSVPAKAAALLIALLLPWPALASVNTAQKDYRAGRFESALREYEKLLRDKPLDARLHYNAGAAAFQAKDYEKAQQHFSAASGGQDTNLQQRALYNLGNAQFRAGEADANISEKLKVWEQALKSYEGAVQLSEKDQDAIYNRDLVRKKLEELKQQQQQQQNNKPDDKKDQDKKDDQQQKDQKDQQQQEQEKDQQKQEQKKPEDQQSQQQEQKQGDKEEQKQPEQKPGEEKKDQQPESGQQQKKPGDKNENGDQGKEAQQVGQQRLIPMTQEQAQRLLEAAKNEERIMIFTPQGRTNRSNRVLKDW
jgi:Ca-activated chloride channel homolog